MSIAEPLPPAARKIEPFQKWYMLFPANWAQLAFDPAWRSQRLQSLRGDQGRRGYGFWIPLALTWFLILLNAVGGLFSSTARGGAATATILSVILLCTVLGQAVLYVKFEVEQILLQVIDRLETEIADHD